MMELGKRVIFAVIARVRTVFQKYNELGLPKDVSLQKLGWKLGIRL